MTFYPSITYKTQTVGRPATFSLNGIYTTKSGVNFSSISDAYREDIEPSTKQGSYSIGFQFSHLFHQLDSNPRQGWGVFAKGAISDGNPNYVQNSIIAGIGGYGLFPERELDSFGVGYFYYDLSDELESTLDVLRDRIGDEQGIRCITATPSLPDSSSRAMCSTSTHLARALKTLLFWASGPTSGFNDHVRTGLGL